MEPRPTTPPEGSQRSAWERPAGHGRDDDDIYAGTDPYEPPPPGEDWSARYGAPPPPPPPRSGPDFSSFFLLLDGLRRAAPAELQEGLRSFIREALLTLRSLIDWYLDRLDRPARKRKVEDIPID